LFGQRRARDSREGKRAPEISMRIFHQRLLAAKVLISDNEADEIVFRTVFPLGAS